MPYDEILAQRIRSLIKVDSGLAEKKMFGGLAFLVNGHMAVAASGQGGLLVRADPADTEALLSTTNAELMVMRGREMPGWLRIDTKDVQDDADLVKWIERGTSYASSLPSK
jgi:TfoX/Sxy family transcriptional regulator of competence genes